MKPLERVLLVADMAPGWESAVDAAIELDRSLGAEVVPIHVVPPALEGVLDMRELRRAIDSRIQEMLRRNGAPPRPFADTIITVGTRFRRVVDEAEERAADAIVIGAGAERDHLGRRVGTTTSRVVRHSRKPVWIAGPGSAGRPRKILCPVDMSGSSEWALRTAVNLAQTFDAELAVLHVIRPLASRHPAAEQLDDQDRLEREHALERRGRFQRLIDGFDFADAHWWSMVREGEPGEQIVSAVRENTNDLVVIGAVGRNQLSRLQIGGVVEDVLGRLPCSVLTVRDASAIYDNLGREIAAGWQLVETGLEQLADGRAEEAVATFERAISGNRFCGPAWEGLAEAQQALGLAAESERSRELARLIAEQP